MGVDWSSLPRLGVGLGYRRELHEDCLRHRDRIDWLELIADHYLSPLPEWAEEAAELARRLPVVPHGLELSVGSHEPVDTAYCRAASKLVALTKAPFYSDHLCMTRAGGLEMGQLTPLPFTRSTARRCAEHARQIQEQLGVPFLLENVFYSFSFPGEMSELQFLQEVIGQAGCGMLLDLTNLFLNSRNHGYDPFAFIDGLPLERVVQVHLAGSERRRDMWIDTHSQPIDSHPEVWELLRYLVSKAPVKAVLIERDQNFPKDFGEILADLDKARAILG
jgi:hypothetical protein